MHYFWTDLFLASRERNYKRNDGHPSRHDKSETIYIEGQLLSFFFFLATVVLVQWNGYALKQYNTEPRFINLKVR